MRLSTTQIYDGANRMIGARQSDMAKLQQQLATGKRISQPSDDPVAAARAATLTAELSDSNQFGLNRAAARDQWAQSESTLGSVGDTLQSIRESLVSAGNSTLNDADRRTIAAGLQSQLDSLVSLANTQDGQGNYVFAGFRDNAAPFARSGNSVSFVGESNVSKIDVSPGNSMAKGVSGADVFMKVPTGNGLFSVTANPLNTGAMHADLGQVTSPAALTGHDYQVVFHNNAGAVTYDVNDLTSGTNLTLASPYTTSAGIAMPGMKIAVAGIPADGDSISIAASKKTDLFSVLKSAISSLNSVSAGTNASVQLSNTLHSLTADLDAGISVVSQQRSYAGDALNSLQRFENTAASDQVQLKSDLSAAEDVDYAKAASDFNAGQVGLQAAMASYTRIAKQSLFDYL